MNVLALLISKWKSASIKSQTLFLYLILLIEKSMCGKAKEIPAWGPVLHPRRQSKDKFFSKENCFLHTWIKWCMDLRVQKKCSFTKETTTVIGSKITFQKFVIFVSREWVYTFKITINGSVILLIILILDWPKPSTRDDSPDLFLKANNKNLRGKSTREWWHS